MIGLAYMPDKDRQFQMRVSQAWLDALDDWRTALRPVPSRAKAIRLLAEKGGLNAPPEEGERRKKARKR